MDPITKENITTFIIALFLAVILLPCIILFPVARLIIEVFRIGPRLAWWHFWWDDKYKKYEGIKSSRKERQEREMKKKMREEQLEKIPDGIRKNFNDWNDWPGAYVVDKIAVYSQDGHTLLYVDDRVVEFEVPEGVVNIYHRCFYKCEALKRVSIPSTVKRIGKMAFFNCVSLKLLKLPESVSFLGEQVFKNCSALVHISMQSCITEIPSQAFCNCRNLTSFEIPSETRIIGTEAFRRCYALRQIVPNEKLEVIRERGFEDCRSLREFIMPESLKFCTKGMFNGCHSLEHIHFSSQIKNFGCTCCLKCYNIRSVTMTKSDSFDTYVQKMWEEFADGVDINTSEMPYPESMFWTLGDTLYFGIPRLTTVCLVFSFSKEDEFTIPSFVTNIKSGAFWICDNLRTLRLAPNVKCSSDPCESNEVSYDFIYENWPQIEHVIFDESLKSPKCPIYLSA